MKLSQLQKDILTALFLMSKSTKNVWSAIDVYQREVAGTPSGIGTSMKTLYKRGYLSLVSLPKATKSFKYKLSEKGREIAKTLIEENKNVK